MDHLFASGIEPSQCKRQSYHRAKSVCSQSLGWTKALVFSSDYEKYIGDTCNIQYSCLKHIQAFCRNFAARAPETWRRKPMGFTSFAKTGANLDTFSQPQWDLVQLQHEKSDDQLIHPIEARLRLQSTLTSTDVSKEEDDYAAKESPPGQASFGPKLKGPCALAAIISSSWLVSRWKWGYSLQSYKELFPGYPLWGSQTQLTNCANVISFNLRPAHQPGQPGFAEDAPPELMRARASQFMWTLITNVN